MGDSTTDPMDVKFADCTCTAAEEAWELLDHEFDGSHDDLVYECQTCGHQHWTSFPVTRV